MCEQDYPQIYDVELLGIKKPTHSIEGRCSGRICSLVGGHVIRLILEHSNLTFQLVP
jgi:hypothetical protein